MSKVLTENSYLTEKVNLRLIASEEVLKKDIKILDCFSADGTLWRTVKGKSKKKLQITRIEKRRDAKGIYLSGNNTKYLRSMDLTQFDIVDLDAFGFALEQLEILVEKGFNGIIIVTFIQLFNCVGNKMLIELGYSKQMINRCRTLVAGNAIEKLKEYLAMKGFTKMKGYFLGNKNYFYTRLSTSSIPLEKTH